MTSSPSTSCPPSPLLARALPPFLPPPLPPIRIGIRGPRARPHILLLCTSCVRPIAARNTPCNFVVADITLTSAGGGWREEGVPPTRIFDRGRRSRATFGLLRGVTICEGRALFRAKWVAFASGRASERARSKWTTHSWQLCVIHGTNNIYRTVYIVIK